MWFIKCEWFNFKLSIIILWHMNMDDNITFFSYQVSHKLHINFQLIFKKVYIHFQTQRRNQMWIGQKNYLKVNFEYLHIWFQYFIFEDWNVITYLNWMHKYLYIFIKLKCYVFDLNAIWMFYIFRLFECLQWLNVVSNIWCFMCLNVKN